MRIAVAPLLRPDPVRPAESTLDLATRLPPDVGRVYVDLASADLSALASADAARALSGQVHGLVPVVDVGRHEDDLLYIGSRLAPGAEFAIAVRLDGTPGAVPDAVARLLLAPSAIGRRTDQIHAVLRIAPSDIESLRETGSILAHAPLHAFATTVIVVDEAPPAQAPSLVPRRLPALARAILDQGRDRVPVFGDTGPLSSEAIAVTAGPDWMAGRADQRDDVLRRASSLGGRAAVAADDIVSDGRSGPSADAALVAHHVTESVALLNAVRHERPRPVSARSRS